MSYEEESTTCRGKYFPGNDQCEKCPEKKVCMAQSVLMVPVTRISYTPDPARNSIKVEEMMETIKSKGVLQPVVATYDKEKNRFNVVFGRRRMEAAKKLDMKEVPLMVRDLDGKESEIVPLIENLQRENLPVMGLAKRLEKLVNEHGMTQKEVAREIGKSETYVSKVMSALKLPESIRKKLEEGEDMSVDTVAELAKIDDAGRAEKLVERGVNREEARKASSPDRKLKYRWEHKGKGYKATIIFNREDVYPVDIVTALEECLEDAKGE